MAKVFQDSPTAVKAPHNAKSHIGSEFPAPGDSPPDGDDEGEVRCSSPGKLGSDMMPKVTAAGSRAAAKVAVVRRGRMQAATELWSSSSLSHLIPPCPRLLVLWTREACRGPDKIKVDRWTRRPRVRISMTDGTGRDPVVMAAIADKMMRLL